MSFAMINPDEISVPSRISHYHILNTIGYGAFSVVKVGYDDKTNQKVAIKVVSRERISTTDLEARFETEIRVLQQMRHPNIVQLLDLIKDDVNFYIIMEFCSGGELFQYIVDHKKLTELEACTFFYQLMDAMKYVHALGAVHRDIKPENLLMEKNNRIKITDFGLSRYVGSTGLVRTACGSPCYASPEILMGNPYDGAKSDIWSCGVILYAMVTGQLPWTKKNQTALFEQIKRGEYKIPQFLSNECKDLITKMLCVDPDKRLSAVQVLQHPWMTLISGETETEKIDAVPRVSMNMVDNFFKQPSDPFFQSDDEVLSARHTGYKDVTRMLKSTNEIKSRLPQIRARDSQGKIVLGKKSYDQRRFSTKAVGPIRGTVPSRIRGSMTTTVSSSLKNARFVATKSTGAMK